MTKGFDDLTLTFYTMTKTIGDTKVKHVSLLILIITNIVSQPDENVYALLIFVI